MRRWQEYENNTQYYYDDIDGMVIGQVHRFGTSNSVYTATVKPDNIDNVLGQFVSLDYAKKSVETFWIWQDRTLPQ
jgi:hypothetical protein